MAALKYFQNGGENNYNQYISWCNESNIKADSFEFFCRIFLELSSGKIEEIDKYLIGFLEDLNRDPEFQNIIWTRYFKWYENNNPASGIIPNRLQKKLEFCIGILAFFEGVPRG